MNTTAAQATWAKWADESPALEPMTEATYHARNLTAALSRLDWHDPEDVLACGASEIHELVRALRVVSAQAEEWLGVLPYDRDPS